ncbi:MAG TPA: YceI family protein [Candidatus Sulfotelmatobacter sp.]|jgi:polyisoprenoid-binding protein YceI|nr:YceI family protein [Candidatus Sulfotelmatobacter sp.]
MKFKAALIALSVATAAIAVPALADAPTTDLSKVEGGSFAVDKSHAKIIFSTTHFGFSTYYGLFTDFDAKLTFDPKAPAKSDLNVTVNLNGIDTTNPKLDEHLKSPDFFNAAQYPTATFKSTKIEVTGATTGKITGDLTLHGVTKPVELDATFNGGGTNPMTKAYVLGFNATGVIKRSEFGIKTYVPAVGDDVTLTISGEFDRQ